MVFVMFTKVWNLDLGKVKFGSTFVYITSI